MRNKPLIKTNEALSQRSEDKSLIKIKKYIALLVCEMSPFSENIFVFKGFKIRKIFYNKKKKKKTVSINGSYDTVCNRLSLIVLMKVIV